jgi:cellobiose phosphorylase
VLDDLYQHCQNFSVSRMYPGLPEYINSRGRGMYPYLTGSASWYLLTLVTEVFGVRGAWGDLSLSPKLVRAQFDAKGHAQIQTVFAGRTITVRYLNPDRLDFDAYKIQTLQLNGSAVTFRRETGRVVIPREMITQLPDKMPHQITVTLGKKEK